MEQMIYCSLIRGGKYACPWLPSRADFHLFPLDKSVFEALSCHSHDSFVLTANIKGEYTSLVIY